jgi:hypothetical protein
LVLPVENPPLVTAPINEAVPVPTEGAVVPVVVLPSGGTLLKFHWAMMSALADGKAATMKQAANSSFSMVVLGTFPGPIECAKQAKNKSKLLSARLIRILGFACSESNPNLRNLLPPLLVIPGPKRDWKKCRLVQHAAALRAKCSTPA